MERQGCGFRSRAIAIGLRLRAPGSAPHRGGGRALIVTFLALAVSVLTAEPARASWYALLIGAEGTNPADSGVFAQDVNNIDSGLTSGKWAGYNLPGHTLTLTGLLVTSANVTTELQALNTAMTGDPDPHLLFYFSGHGGTSTLGGKFNVELTPPSINTQSEYIVFNPTTFDGLYDFSLPKLITSQVPKAAHSLFILDSCKSGGFFYGNPTVGQGGLETIPTSYLIASAREDQNSPLNSTFSANFTTYLNTKFGAFTGPQIAAGIGYSNLAFTGLRRDNLLGENEILSFNNVVTDTVSSFNIGPDTSAIGLLSVPEPGSLHLLLESGLIAGLAWCRRGPGPA